jgi:hypothetical protein
MVGDYKVHKLWNFYRLASRANARATPLVSFKAPSSSYHHFLCPIGSLGLLIACLLHSLKLPSLCHLFAIFDPQYGLTSYKYY